MNKICVVTGTRAEYYLLRPLLKRIVEEQEMKLQLVVTGSHISDKFGCTYQAIESDGFVIDKMIPIIGESDSYSDINRAISRAIIGFDNFFINSSTDMLVLLGDRYELLAAAITAMNYQIPIAHIHGGETTEGAIDECIRHSITKMSYLHFTSCEAYRRRVIQLGENPERVFNVGGLGVENIKNTKRMSLKELEDSLAFSLEPQFMIVTFHPVTLDKQSAESEFQELLDALSEFPQIKVLFTKANADAGGMQINKMIDAYVDENACQCTSVHSLGVDRYISALSYAAVVVGNSSSGILETPSFAVPTVNIGDRQKGRIQAKNILNCPPQKSNIQNAIEIALSPAFRLEVKNTKSPYGNGNASYMILDILKKTLGEHINIKKKFYDVVFDY